jgi:sulfate permease, SulP family
LLQPKTLKTYCQEVDKAERAVVAIALRGKSELSSTFINVLERYAQSLKAQNSKLMLVGVDPMVYGQLEKTGLLYTIGEENIFYATRQLGEAINMAVAAANQWLEKPAGAPAIANPLPERGNQE